MPKFSWFSANKRQKAYSLTSTILRGENTDCTQCTKLVLGVSVRTSENGYIYIIQSYLFLIRIMVPFSKVRWRGPWERIRASSCLGGSKPEAAGARGG